MTKSTIFKFIIIYLALMLVTACQSTANYKKTLLPEEIILNNQTQTDLPDEAPEITAVNHYPRYPVTHIQLINGINVYYIQTHHLINTSTLYALAFKRDGQYPRVLNDLFLNWNALLLDTSYSEAKPQRLSILAENTGATLRNFSMNKIYGKYLLALNEDSEAILYLLGHLVTGLHFSSQELQRVKLNLGVSKRVESVSGHNLTWQLFKKLSLPDTASNLTTPDPALYRKQRQQATLSQFRQFVNNSLLPEKASLIILSPRPFNKIQPLLEQYFSQWRGKAKHLPNKNSSTLEAKNSDNFNNEVFWAIKRDASTQVDIRIGFWPQSLTNKEHQSLKILSELLAGGGLASRMTHDLRENKGLTYFISSSIARFSTLDSLQFVSSTEPHKLPALLEGMKRHIQTTLHSSITQTEFRAIKKRLIVKAQRNLLTDYQQLGQMLQLLADNSSTGNKIQDLAVQSQLLEQLSYQDFQKALTRLRSIPQITLLAGDKESLKHHLCKYYTKCKIHWYNNELH